MKKISFLRITMFFLLVNTLACNSSKSPDLGQQKIMALAWYQSSGEFKGLCYQAYHTAKMVLDNDIKNPPRDNNLKRAVIMDIDETIFNNTPCDARQAVDNMQYPYMWPQWVEKEEAEAIPGSVEFLKYVDGKNVDIYYITNRAVTQAVFTLQNLKNDGFPQATLDHLLCQGDTRFVNPNSGDKEARRQFVEKDHRVVMFCGDNLNDFEQLFWNKSASERSEEADDEKAKWGTVFIILPNPVYGDWENALYNYNYSLSPADMDSKRKAALKIFYQ